MEPQSLAAELESASEHMEWLQALAVAMVADRHTAEDLVQRALLEAGRTQSWEPGRLRAWLTGVVRKLAKQHFRTESRRRSREQRVVEAAEARALGIRDAAAIPTPEELAQQVEAQNLLSGAVMDLPEKYRTVMLQFYYGEWSQKRIADHHGISVRAVETRLRRARERLRIRLEGEYGKESWALSVLPLLLRLPPPKAPPTVTAAGAGSVGAGWWTSLAAGLALGVWFGIPDSQRPEESSQLAQAPQAPDSSPQPVSATRAMERQPEPPAETAGSPILPPEANTLQILCLERGTGKVLAGQPVRLSFLRAPAAEEILTPGNLQYFSPRDRVFVRLGDGETHSDAEGVATLQMPEGTTILYLSDGLHTPTHSRVGYGQGGVALPRPPAARQPIPLEWVRRTGDATGFVLDAEGVPLAQAVVDVVYFAPQLALPAPTLSVPTEADGSFHIPNIACDQGGFLLRPRLPGYRVQRSLRMERYAGFGKDYPGITLGLAAAEESVSISVVTEEGHGVAGAEIRVRGEPPTTVLPRYAYGSYQPTAEWLGTTGSAGQLHWDDLPRGALRFVIEHEGYLPRTYNRTSQQGDFQVVLQKGLRLELQLQAEGEHSLTGAVVGLHQKRGSRFQEADTHGQATFTGIEEGEDVSLTVVHPGFAVAGWQHRTLHASTAETITMMPGQVLRGRVDFQDAPAQGKLLARVFVRAKGDPGIPFLASPGQPRPTLWQLAGLDAVTPQAEGDFHFHGLPDASLEVWFGQRRRPLARTLAHSGETEVLLIPGQGMEAFAQVDLLVRERLSGRPVLRYYLAWSREVDGLREVLPLVQVRAQDGQYRQVGLPPGEWSLLVWAPQGYTTVEIPPRHFSAGPATLEVDLLAARSLKVQLVDVSGQAIPGAEIQVQDARGHLLLQGGRLGVDASQWTSTDTRGRVTLSQVPLEETYRLVCRFAGTTQEFALPSSSVEGEMRTLTWTGPNPR